MSDKSRNTNNQEYVGHISTEHNLSNIYDYCIEMCSIINKYLYITHTSALPIWEKWHTLYKPPLETALLFKEKKSEASFVLLRFSLCAMKCGLLWAALFGVCLSNWMTLRNDEAPGLFLEPWYPPKFCRTIFFLTFFFVCVCVCTVYNLVLNALPSLQFTSEVT